MKHSSTLPTYIGYEEREHKAYEVCEHSLRLHSPDVVIHKLRSQDIQEYNRNFGEPQSTDFTFTRFWVPYLSDYKGYSVFVDCDFLFLCDIHDILDYVDESKAVSVVQHPPYYPHSAVKMDGVAQHTSYRKNWASLMVFNNGHLRNRKLNPAYLNSHRPGLDFHHLAWLDDKDIGSLPLEWNCLDDYYHLESPRAIHYTDGGPWFEKYKHTMYSNIWIDYEKDIVRDD